MCSCCDRVIDVGAVDVEAAAVVVNRVVDVVQLLLMEW